LSRWKYSRGADHLISVSHRVEEVLIEDGVPPDRVTVVHSGIDLATPPPPPGPSLRERVGASPEAPLIVTISTVEDYKDHPTLIEAASRLADRQPAAQWVVCGAGRLLEAMREEVMRRSLDDRVHYLGFVPGARGLLPEADVFVLSSKTEGLGTSVLDAMAAGVPIATTRGGGIPEMIEHEKDGLLASVGDARELSRAVDRLLDDPALARRLTDEARRRVSDFDIRRTVEATERIYREVLARRRSVSTIAGDGTGGAREAGYPD
jgi:glycosyltransferase involved in cell wall biosynthesis